jgi:hypothetical protein
MDDDYGGNLIPPHIVQKMIDGMAAYDAKMVLWVQTAETSSPYALVECRHEPTIAECLEEFKSRTARDELPGEG